MRQWICICSRVSRSRPRKRLLSGGVMTRRIQVTQAESIGDYIDLLRTDANEVQNLFNDLLIGVTQFHFALRHGGYVFRGNAENVTRHPKLFEPVECRSRLFRRRETGTRVLPDFPITSAP